MKYELKIEADTINELLELFANLKDRPINEIPKANKVTVELGDNALAEQVVAEKPQQDKAAEKVYTLDELTTAAAPLLDKPGGLEALSALLSKFSVPTLRDLAKTDFPAFAEGLRELGVAV